MSDCQDKTTSVCAIEPSEALRTTFFLFLPPFGWFVRKKLQYAPSNGLRCVLPIRLQHAQASNK